MKRILTGDRTTGKLHLGHYIGSLKNRVDLQDHYDTMIILADVQALTTHFKDPSLINDSIYQVAIDNLSVGLDPDKVTLFQQSQVKSIAELTVFYSMFVSVNTLRHNPTVKTEAKQYGYDDLSYGFLGYPVSQAADITFCKADLIPVGEDQLPHVEQTRKIVRRFNDLYHGEEGHALFAVPEALLSQTPRLVGLDGQGKMGKSLGNAIYLSDDEGSVIQKVKSAVTDPSRIRKTDPGHPEICTVATYQKVFNPNEVDNIYQMCRKGAIGCAACKNVLCDKINTLLEPIRDKRNYYEEHRNEVKEIIKSGTNKANSIGNQTVEEVKDLMSLSIF